MIQKYLLNISENKYSFEEEEKQKFLQSILETFELNVSELFENKTIENKVKLKNLLYKNNLKTINEEDFIIYFENKEIARMKKPFYKIMKDLSEINRKDQLYIEATIEFEVKI
jgi:hypothetical protein